METFMLRDRLDRNRLRAALRELADECTRIKRLLRATWERPMADEQRRACRLRRNLTELHILLAWTRARLHVTSSTQAGAEWDARAHAARIAERLAPDYATDVTTATTEPGEVRP
jgi:hypothetical protein